MRSVCFQLRQLKVTRMLQILPIFEKDLPCVTWPLILYSLLVDVYDLNLCTSFSYA